MRFFALLLCTTLCSALAQQRPPDRSPVIHGKNGITLPPPPVVNVAPVVDEYRSAESSEPVKVTDNYRWLEDARSPETRAFIKAENAYTQKYLDQLKILPQVRQQIAALLRVDFYGLPQHRGDRYFFVKRLASENQGSIYMRQGLHASDELLVDATRLSSDQNTSVNILDIAEDGSLLAYGERVGGADEQEVHFLNLANRQPKPDVLPSARYYGVQIGPGNSGVYYSKFFPHQGTRVFYHAFGAPGSDKQLFGGEYKGRKLGEIDTENVHVTPNGHYLVLTLSHGVPPTRVDILLKDLRNSNSDFTPLVYGVEARFIPLNIGDSFYVDTDYKAPNHRILKAEPGKAPDQWSVIVPEDRDVIEQASLVDGKLYILRLHDVSSQLTIYTLDGKKSGAIQFPGLGAGSTVQGRPDQKGGFYTFQSIISPPTTYYFDTTTGRSQIFAATKAPFNPADYTLVQVFYNSKDGTRIPMFIAGRKGLKRDGSERLLMTGYGGFASSERPSWNPAAAWWLERGGWFALPNLRGGNEYGEAWHKAAMFEHKQNVFDDWFAAAEYLIKEKYTSPQHLAITGRSNGGLLMGASMTQHPELFGAIWCGYPLLDMLRYQRFLMGRTWTTEYGSAENPQDFPYIYKYSPYQHVVPGTKYPAIMFVTGDADTRVDPMNARKMTALMQASSGGDRPILLHYSEKGGHSSGISQTQLTEEDAIEIAFLWNETGTP